MSEQDDGEVAQDEAEIEQSGSGYGYVTVAESRVEDPRNDIPAGTQTLRVGKDSDPDYTVMLDNGIQEIRHKIVERIQLPERMTKSDAIEYVRENHAPEGDDAE